MKLNLLLVPLFVFGVHTVANSKKLTGTCIEDYRNYSLELKEQLREAKFSSEILSSVGVASILGGVSIIRANVDGFGFPIVGIGSAAIGNVQLQQAQGHYTRALQIHQLISEAYLGDGLLIRTFKKEFELKISSKKISKMLRTFNEDRSLCNPKLLDTTEIADLIFFKNNREDPTNK